MLPVTFRASTPPMYSLAVLLLLIISACPLKHSGTEASNHIQTSTTEQTESTEPDAVPRPPTDEEILARHFAEDRDWASRTGLEEEQVRELRLKTGIEDDFHDYIELIDAECFRSRG